MSTTELKYMVAESTTEWAQEKLDLSIVDIAEVLGISRRTIQRWNRKEHVPSRSHLERLEKLNELRFLLESVFRDNDAALKWLWSPCPAFKGKTPISLLLRSEIKPVLGALASIESGAFL
ncbi:antitoxin Xre/MbcA/ParS toxin-binding domain-containing protein [Gemmatimonadota bacterium]